MSQIIPWKGPATNSVVPSFSRPLLGTEEYNTGPAFRPRPIKHWRKQLNPRDEAGRQRPGIGMPMDTPGGSVYLGTTNCITCGTDTNSAGIKEDIEHGTIIPSTPADIYINPETKQVKCVACNPENNVIKSAVTLLNKNYYTDSRAYMKARCRLYDQRASTNPKPGVTYFNPNGTPANPSDSPNGSQVRLMQDCDKQCTLNNQPITIYKPNNRQFATQGAVSSSTRLLRLQYNTITKNAASFNAAWGQEGANAGRYQGTQEAPYFLKSRYQPPRCFHRNGNKNLCTITNAPYNTSN
jgi:hypothetical protein